MKRQITGLLLLAAVTQVHAQNDVFLCVDGSGRKEYKNTGLTKGCKKVDLPGITMITAPESKAVARAASTKPAEVTPTTFPKVDSDTQKIRDNDRRRILQYEMKSEQEKLAELKKEFNNGQPERRGNERNYAKYLERVAMLKEDIGRTEKNIEALERELGNLK